MLMTEKKIQVVRVKTQLDEAELDAIETLDFIAENMLIELESHGKENYHSIATGELIGGDDLKRLRGILQALNHCKEWVLE